MKHGSTLAFSSQYKRQALVWLELVNFKNLVCKCVTICFLFVAIKNSNTLKENCYVLFPCSVLPVHFEVSLLRGVTIVPRS